MYEMADFAISFGWKFILLALAGLVFLFGARLVDAHVFKRVSFESALRDANLAVGTFLGLLGLGFFIAVGLILGMLVLVIAMPPVGQAQAADFDKYDTYFKRYGEVYFPQYSWRWWKAQGIAESKLNPRARSPVGAMGVMQFMPATAADEGLVDPWNPELSILHGIRYDRKLHRLVCRKTQQRYNIELIYPDDLRLTFASYNAGAGNILKAQKRASNTGFEPSQWTDIAKSLHLVTGRHADETRGYVARIEKLYHQLSKEAAL